MTDDQPLGELIKDDGRVGFRFVRRLSSPPELVWHALTESDQLRHWLPTDIVGERREGAPIDLPFWPDHIERFGISEPALHGVIRIWDPPRLFEWTWDRDVLRWELQPTAQGTRLIFTTWLSDTGPASIASVGAGYHVCLDQLAELVASGAVISPLLDRDAGPWEARYAAAAVAAYADPGATDAT